MLRPCAALLAALAVVACGRGATIRVPGDAPTIQAAIDQASDGDTVLVAPGVYPETIDLLGKQITLRSEQGAEQTIIDGQGHGPVVRISRGPGAQPVIEGFTITGGGQPTPLPWGSGILSDGMGPVIRDCVIRGNVSGGFGIGVALVSEPSLPVVMPRLERCVIRDNTQGNNSAWGGGLVVGGGPMVAEIVDCVIENNEAVAAGGVLVWGSADVRFVRSVIRGNRSMRDLGIPDGVVGTAVFVAGGSGEPAQVRLEDCLVVDNRPLRVSDDIQSIVVAIEGSTLRLERTTVVEDPGVAWAAIYTSVPARIEIDGSVVMRRKGPFRDREVYLAPGAVLSVRYSLLMHGRERIRGDPNQIVWGPGNLEGRAGFRDPNAGDYTLLPDSPLIDAGDPQAGVPPDARDALGHPRMAFCRVDIGALESPYFADCNRNGLPDACETLGGMTDDCNGNLVPDTCIGLERDCNDNGIPDRCDIALGTSHDVNRNGMPDECEPDCNGNGIPDAYELASGLAADCNANGLPDDCDIADGSDTDCNGNGVPDACDLADGTIPDCDANGQPDACQRDCDGDGVIDVCAIAPRPDFEKRVVALGGRAAAVGLADFDGDGAVDLAVGREGPPNGLDVLFGDGQGGFGEVRTVPVVRPPARLVVHDLDADGDPDVVLLTRENDVSVLWVIHTEQERAFASVQSVLFSPALADGVVTEVNGDGWPDAVVVFESGANPIVVLPGQPAGRFAPVGSRIPTTRNWRRVRPADLDADGDVDLIVGGGNSGIAILLNDGAGHFARGGRLRRGGEWQFEPADLNGDGLSDLVAVSSQGQVATWINEGEGVLVPGQGASGPTPVVDVAVADVAGDAVPDLLYVRGQGATGARLVVMPGVVGEPFTFELGARPLDLALGDVDGNGAVDAAIGVAGADEAVLMLNRAFHPAAADCNDDGVPDSCQIADGTLHDVDGDGLADECTCPADLNGDRQIDIGDVSIVVSNFGVTRGATFADGDLDGDGDVDLGDLGRLLPFVGLVCTP